MYTFIVVDDEVMIRKGLLKKISKVELPLVCIGEAKSGKEAIELITIEKPDIILTDMKMPVMDGRNLLEYLFVNYPEIIIIVISGYSNFEYTKVAISSNVIGYLLKPINVEEIKEQFVKAITKIEHEKKRAQEIEQITFTQESYNIQSDILQITNHMFHHKHKSEITIQSNSFSFLKEMKTGYLLIVLSKQGELPSEYVSILNERNTPNEYIAFEHPRTQDFFFVIIGITVKSPIEVKKRANSITEEILQKCGENTIKIISKEFSSLTCLDVIYDELLEYLNHCNISEQHKIIYCQNQEQSPHKRLEWKQEEEFLFFLRKGNTTKCVNLLQIYFNYLKNDEELIYLELKTFVKRLLSKIRIIIYEMADIEYYGEYALDNYDKHIDLMFDIELIERSLLNTLQNILAIFKNLDAFSTDNLVEQMMNYIEQNYTKKITRDQIAEMFHITPSYVSILFKEKTGDSFLDYVNKKRIETAKNLLVHTDEKIYLIAKKLWFSNEKYFSKTFKKYTGYSPSEFRSL